MPRGRPRKDKNEPKPIEQEPEIEETEIDDIDLSDLDSEIEIDDDFDESESETEEQQPEPASQPKAQPGPDVEALKAQIEKAKSDMDIIMKNNADLRKENGKLKKQVDELETAKKLAEDTSLVEKFSRDLHIALDANKALEAKLKEAETVGVERGQQIDVLNRTINDLTQQIQACQNTPVGVAGTTPQPAPPPVKAPYAEDCYLEETYDNAGRLLHRKFETDSPQARDMLINYFTMTHPEK